ncbi:MAG TPA: response regulator transcription factor [Thermoleophilaceae bacterium]|jgi:two-component system response regulator RegX3
MEKSRLLVVEDEEAIRTPLAEALASEGFAVETAATAAQALETAERTDPDLVLLDLMLPDGSGFDVARRLRERGPVPIIMLTARGDEADRVIGLELGADDYVVKPFSAREVAARVRAVLRRAGAAERADDGAPQALNLGDVELDPAARTVARGGDPLDLTRKEYELLELLMVNAGVVVTRERALEEVWDTDWFGSSKTLDVHVSGLRRKLGDDPAAPRYIHTVRGVGFRFAARKELERE